MSSSSVGFGPAGGTPDYRLLFESAPPCMAVLDADLRLVSASEEFLRATGTTRDQAIGASVFDLEREEPGSVAGAASHLRPSLARVLAEGVPDATAPQMVLTQRPAEQGGGSEARYLATVNTPVLEEGRVAYIIHWVQDVTGYVLPRQDDVNRMKWEAEEAKTDFVSRVSREVRTPLSTILGFAELLAFGSLSEEQQMHASAVVTAAKRLASFMDDFQYQSRTQASDLMLLEDAVPAARVVTEAMDLIQPLAASQSVHLDPPTLSGVQVFADEERLCQALVQLLSNAIKYNHPAGEVSVSVSSQSDGWVRLNVTDTGPGIAEADLDRVFVPFERLDAALAGVEGTGLGLTLSRQLVEAMGGRAGVTSTPGVGSTFWVELPAAPSELGSSGADPIAGETIAYASPKTLMYVEDMVDNLRLVEHILKRRPSVRIVPALLGREALDLAKAEHHPDMILLDRRLPDMSGEELLRRFQTDPATRGTPVVVFSSDTDEEQISRLLAAGAVAYLTKPIKVRSFLTTIDHLLG